MRNNINKNPISNLLMWCGRSQGIRLIRIEVNNVGDAEEAESYTFSGHYDLGGIKRSAIRNVC